MKKKKSKLSTKKKNIADKKELPRKEEKLLPKLLPKKEDKLLPKKEDKLLPKKDLCSICGIQMSGTDARNLHFPICKRRQILREHNYSLPPCLIDDALARYFRCKGDYINAQESTGFQVNSEYSYVNFLDFPGYPDDLF